PDAPYCPLRPYGPEHRPLYFGREEEMLRLAGLLDQDRSAGVILHGSAAVGKTSLVQAGLWPYLEQECIGYRVLCDRTPGEGLRELWLALREDPARLGRLLDDVTRQLPYELVITIDQAEELLTLVESATERERRRQALDMLLALAESPARCKVLLLLRTEYF